MISILKQLPCKIGLFVGLIIFVQLSFATDLQKCIGKICIGENALTYREIRAKFHAVKVKNMGGVDWRRSLCLFDRSTGVSMILSFSGDKDLHTSKLDGIFLTNERLCEKCTRKPHPFSLRTEDGFQIGQSKQSILEKIGSPSRIDNAIEREQKDSRYENTRYGSVYGVSRLHYEGGTDSLLFNQFGIDENGTVVSIWLNDSP